MSPLPRRAAALGVWDLPPGSPPHLSKWQVMGEASERPRWRTPCPGSRWAKSKPLSPVPNSFPTAWAAQMWAPHTLEAYTSDMYMRRPRTSEADEPVSEVFVAPAYAARMLSSRTLVVQHPLGFWLKLELQIVAHFFSEFSQAGLAQNWLCSKGLFHPGFAYLLLVKLCSSLLQS